MVLVKKIIFKICFKAKEALSGIFHNIGGGFKKPQTIIVFVFDSEQEEHVMFIKVGAVLV